MLNLIYNLGTTLFNAFYLRNELIPLLPEYDRSIDALHANEMSTDFFQTYDGKNETLSDKMSMIYYIL